MSPLIAHFLAGAFLVNGIPHLVNGVSGRAFPTPFAKPPGRGLSSPLVNVLWAAANFVAGDLLIAGFGPGAIVGSNDLAVTAAGGLVMAVGLAWHFGRVLRGKP